MTGKDKEDRNMKLRDLVRDIPCRVTGNTDIEIRGMQYDSRKVQPGDLFFCIKGFATDGHQYAQKAVEQGAVCLMVSEPQEIEGVSQIIVEDGREGMALLSAAFYGHPARQLRMVGVTGTNGKTSTTYMLKSIFEQEGSKVGLLGTIQNMIGDRVLHTERTTPESMDLHKLLREMADDGVDTVVMEVSSHSLVLKRVFGIAFAGAVFTNLTQDHLDFHGNFENYQAAKALLFAASQNSAINIDDPHGDFMRKAAAGKVNTYSAKGEADVMARDIQLGTDGCRFIMKTSGATLPILMNIPGMFSVYNALSAITISFMLGVDMMHIKLGLLAVKNVPGRFQQLDTHGGDYSVILDYCHTPDSLESTLKTVRGFAKGRIVCLFGCGGNRDNLKRPIMGEIAERLADFTIVTSDNPRFEEPMEIIRQILAGMKKDNHVVIENRRDAIRFALEHARKDDVIVLAGKGHEDYQEIRGVKHPFDEKVIVEELLAELGR